MVRVTGVEPARLVALDPKSSTSANSAIPADIARFFLYDSYRRQHPKFCVKPEWDTVKIRDVDKAKNLRLNLAYCV